MNTSQSSTLPEIQHRLHVGENLMYQIHKKALQEYLKNGNIDQRIVSMNLLNLSQLKDEELYTLKQAFQKKTEQGDVESAKILAKFRPRYKSNGTPIYFKKTDYTHEDQELNQLEERLKVILKSKLNTCKVFNGTYLVDPSISDLRGTFKPQQIYKKKLPSIKRQPSCSNFRNAKQIQQISEQRLHDSQISIKELKDKYKESKLSNSQKIMFQLIEEGDVGELRLLMKHREIPLDLLNTPNSKGYYPIHMVIKQKDYQMLKLLLSAGVDTTVRTRKGKSVKQLCEIYFNEETYQLIYGTKRQKQL